MKREREIRMTRLLLNHIRSHGKCEWGGWEHSRDDNPFSLSLFHFTFKHSFSREIKHENIKQKRERVLNIFMMIIKIYQHAQWHIYSHYSIGIIKERVCSISSHTHTHIHSHAIIMCLVRVIIISDNKTIKNSFRAQACDRRNNLMSFAVSLS